MRSLLHRAIAQQLERRVQFRRAMKRVMQNAMRLGAEGIKVRYLVDWVVLKSPAPKVIARVEYRFTRRADIDYATAERSRPTGFWVSGLDF